ncbi:unnamed protein product, partial [Rotaria socialis]
NNSDLNFIFSGGLGRRSGGSSGCNSTTVLDIVNSQSALAQMYISTTIKKHNASIFYH